jgi:AsmA family protein
VRRTLLIILAAAGGLVTVLLVVIAIVAWRVDPNDYVAPIQARIKQATGREATIRGGIELKLSLTPRLVVHDLALANAPWGRSPTMVTAKQLDIEVALLPLVQSRLEVIRVGLVEPTIALETDGQGHVNWDFSASATGTTPASGTSTPATAIGVGAIAISNGTLTYRDGKAGALTTVTIEAIELSARDAQAKVNAKLKVTIDDVALDLSGQLDSPTALVQKRWPYAIALAGEVDGQKARFGTKVRVDGDTVHLEDLDIAAGDNVVSGTVSIATGGPRWRYTVDLTAPVWSLGALAGAHARAAGAPAARATPAARPPPAYLFPDTPLPLAILRVADAAGQAKVGRLVVSPKREFTAVEIHFTLHEGHLDVPLLKGATFGGTVDAHGTLDLPSNGSPTIALAVDAHNLDLGAELAALDVRREVKGGKTSVKADLHARGATLHEWAASASGNVTAIAGPATIVNAKLDPDNAFDRVAKAANPFRDKDPTTELKCAVVRLPLADGVAHIDRSVAVETQKLGVSVSGTLDLRNESIDLTFKPQLREGIPIDIPQVAELVRLRGPLRSPNVTIDAVASVATAARIGAAVGTGGLSEVANALFGAVTRGGAGPCAVALGTSATSAPSKNTRASAAAPGADSINKALGRLLGR